MQLIVSILSPTHPPRTIGDLPLEPDAPITIGGLETDTVWLGDGIDAAHQIALNLMVSDTDCATVMATCKVFSGDAGPVIFHCGDRKKPVLAFGREGETPPTNRYIDLDPLAEITVFRLTMCGVEIGLLFLAADNARHAYPWLSDDRSPMWFHGAVTAVFERLGEIGDGIKGLADAASEHDRVLNDVADSMERLMEEGELDERESLYLSQGPHDDDDYGDEPSAAELQRMLDEARQEAANNLAESESWRVRYEKTWAEKEIAELEIEEIRETRRRWDSERRSATADALAALDLADRREGVVRKVTFLDDGRVVVDYREPRQSAVTFATRALFLAGEKFRPTVYLLRGSHEILFDLQGSPDLEAIKLSEEAVLEAIRESKAHRMEGRLAPPESVDMPPTPVDTSDAVVASVEVIAPVETSVSPRGTKAPPTLAGIARIRVAVYRGNLLISRAGFDAPCLIRIGALKSSEICLHDQEGSVARMHSAIEASADTVRLIDFGSASGTKLGGEEIDKNAELKDGDEIGIRGYRIVVHFDRGGGGDRDDKNKAEAAPSRESSSCSDEHCFDDTSCAMGWADKADCDRMPSAAATPARPASYAWLSRRKSGHGVKPLVYVAGPYTADTDEQRLANIAAAQAWGAKVIDAGGIPIIPHNMDKGIADKADAEFWYTATLELMLRCDVVLLMPGAGESIGARAEEEAAHESGMPVIDAGKLLPGVRLCDCISGIAVATVDPHAAARRRRDRDASELKRIKDQRSQIAGLRAELRHVKGGDRCN